jgi:hypothetical protein
MQIFEVYKEMIKMDTVYVVGAGYSAASPLHLTPSTGCTVSPWKRLHDDGRGC